MPGSSVRDYWSNIRLRLRLRLFIDLTEAQTTVYQCLQNTRINTSTFIMLAMASIKIDSKY